MDSKVHIEMNKLKINGTWIPLIPRLKDLQRSHVIIPALKTILLQLHFENIQHAHFLQMFHIFMSYGNKSTPIINRYL